MTQENLLELIAKDTNHAFNNVLKISNDCNKITTFCGKERLVYGPKKAYLEVLGRQIFADTYLENDKPYYLEEEQEEDGCRSDLLTKLLQTEQKQNVIEIKVLSSESSMAMFKTEIENAFNQVRIKYLTNNGDAFVSIVIMDVEKIVKDPINLEKFKTINENNKINDKKSYSLFKKFGIFIITKKYLKTIENYDEDLTWFDIPKHCLIEVNREESELDEFKIPQRVANIKDAIRFPTSSSSYGIKNVRDIKDPEEDTEKLELLIDIFKTTLKAFEKNDISIINKRGKEKDFVYIKNETIISSHAYKERSSYAFTTMNGAIVDGQNSIDCFKTILDFLNFQLSDKKSYQPFFYKKLLEIMNIGRTFSERDITELKCFLERVKITIKTTSAENVEEATNIAINKNNTMPVTENELQMSQNMDAIQTISNQMLIDEGYVIGYPKRTDFGISEKYKKEKFVDFSKLANIYQVYRDIMKKNEFELKEIYNLKNKLARKNNKHALDDLIRDFSEISNCEDSEDIQETNREIQDNKKDASRIKSDIKLFESMLDQLADPSEFLEKIEKFERDLLQLESKERMLKEKRKKQSIVNYIPKNIDLLADIMEVYLSITNLVLNEVDEIVEDHDVAMQFKKKSSLHKESMIGYVLIMFLRMSKDKKLRNQIKNINLIKSLINKAINGSYKVEVLYKIPVTILMRTSDIIERQNGYGSERVEKVLSEYFGEPQI